MLLTNEESKEKVDDYDIEIQRVYVAKCDKCNSEVTIIKDNEDEIKEHLIDELEWVYNLEFDEEDGSDVLELVCDECKMLIEE